MKLILSLIGVLLLSGCADQTPMVKVFMKTEPLKICNDRPVARKLDLRDNSVMTGTGDTLVCENGKCAVLKFGECFTEKFQGPLSEGWQLMPVVTFDSRMANDPEFKASVLRVEY